MTRLVSPVHGDDVRLSGRYVAWREIYNGPHVLDRETRREVFARDASAGDLVLTDDLLVWDEYDDTSHSSTIVAYDLRAGSAFAGPFPLLLPGREVPELGRIAARSARCGAKLNRN